MNTFLIENVLDKTIKRILEVVQPRKILIFGSAYRGDMHDDSDIDLLVIVSSGTHRRRTAHTIYRNLIGVGFAVDIIVVTEEDVEKYRNNPGMIIQHVLEEGRVLYAA
jgi:predicted nucleotidyltransferase